MRRLILFGWMALIFFASADSASGERSWAFMSCLLKLAHMSGFEVSAQFDLSFFHFCLRKAAHVAEYAVLCALWRWNGLKSKDSLVVVFLCACLDEWHQSFVVSRVGCLSDVFVDWGGAWAALIIERLASLFFYQIKQE
ncbi:MAG: VanZ family protein [Candidatus Bruticola sp.]